MSKKGLYHSELAKMSPVTAKILSEPTESRFPDRPRWVAIEIDGEERFLNCENVSVELALAGLKGQWARLNASGRGEDAVIEVYEAEGKSAKLRPISPDSGRIKSSAAKAEKEKPPTDDVLSEYIPTPSGVGDSPLQGYAAHAGRIFALAWEESANAMSLIPGRDAEELTAAQWLDLRLRIAQGFQIEINKILRRERF